MNKLFQMILGEKINHTRIVPITTKIILIFTIFILASNLSSNYINLLFNRTEQINLMKELLVKDLKNIYSFCNNQYEIYQFNKDMELSVKNMEVRSLLDFKNKKSVSLGIKTNGEFLFQASRLEKEPVFKDQNLLDLMKKNHENGILEGFVTLHFKGEDYFAVYRYNAKWDSFLVRGEEFSEFYGPSRTIFRNISIIIILMTLVVSLIGIFLLRYILKYLGLITSAIMNMSRNQQMGLLDIKNAPNDDVTFLGVAFNSLSSTINNLVNIFRKFANKDVAVKAYRDHEVRLEGTQMDLTCLFSDIKGFTYMTEILGTDIITLINMHYDKAIREIIAKDAIIGSIIGDALLAVYGVMNESGINKSYQAVLSAYKIQDVAHSLREQMIEKRKLIELEKGSLTDTEERIYQAVLIQVGVGIDGGIVFYGNIGSYERMTNTVIGDNVNSASRLEGLTRIYHVPVICSDYVKEDIENHVPDHNIRFIELDRVKVKGKTISKRVYWPIMESQITKELDEKLKYFSEGLQYYYQGNWDQATQKFNQCKELELTLVFHRRIANQSVPEGWNGTWEMTTK